MKSSKIVFFYSLLLISLISSCKVNKEGLSTGGGTSQASTEEIEPGTPQIIFLNYSIHKNAAGNTEIGIIDKMIVKGELKKNLQPNPPAKTGDLICIELDASAQTVHTLMFLTH